MSASYGKAYAKQLSNQGGGGGKGGGDGGKKGGSPPPSVATAYGQADTSKGIFIMQHTPSGGSAIDVWCDLHQRKHVVNGDWPGDTKSEGGWFKSALLSRSNPALARAVAQAVNWGLVTGPAGKDFFFDCGASVVGTAGETYVWAQCYAALAKGAVSTYAFHVVPFDEAHRLYSKQKKNMVALDVSNLLGTG